MRKIFNKLFGRKKRVLIVYQNVSNLTNEAAKQHIQTVAETFKSGLGDDYVIFVVPTGASTKVEMLPL